MDIITEQYEPLAECEHGYSEGCPDCDVPNHLPAVLGGRLTPVPGATPRYDDDGREIVEVMTCGACGRSWNDAAVSGITPVPSGRCPFEYEHEGEEE